jgi:phosphatidylinositol glycan class V
MSVWNPYSRPLEHPVKTLALLFVLWKALLLGVAVASPGPGYDTSTQILLRASTARAGGQTSFIYSLGERLALKLMRWDAIYFVKSAERGYLNEQDWAFSWACTRFIRLLARGITLSITYAKTCANAYSCVSTSWQAACPRLYLGRSCHLSRLASFVCSSAPSSVHQSAK